MTYSTLYLWCVGSFLPAAADGFVEVEQVEAGGELVVEQVLAEAVGAELGLQGGVEGFAAVAEELAVVAHLLLRGAFGLLQFLLLGVEGVLGLVGAVYVGEGLQQGLVVLQQGGLQAGVGGLDVGADAAGGEEGKLYADAEEAAVAAAGAVEGGEVAVELDAAGLPEELDVETGEEVGFGAGELGAAGLDFGGAGAQVGARWLRRLPGRMPCGGLGRCCSRAAWCMASLSRRKLCGVWPISTAMLRCWASNWAWRVLWRACRAWIWAAMVVVSWAVAWPALKRPAA